jgi:hypothetical protein
MLHNVVIHIANEQPIMADLESMPSPSDVALICQNLRTMNGKKPVFVDHAESTFVIPLVHVRFVEIPQAEMEALVGETAAAPPASAKEPVEEEYPEPPLARLAWVTGEGEATGPADGAGEAGEAGSEASASEIWPEDEARRQAAGAGLDGDLLRRIREV